MLNGYLQPGPAKASSGHLPPDPGVISRVQPPTAPCFSAAGPAGSVQEAYPHGNQPAKNSQGVVQVGAFARPCVGATGVRGYICRCGQPGYQGHDPTYRPKYVQRRKMFTQVHAHGADLTWIFTEFVACPLASFKVVRGAKPAQEQVVSRGRVVVDPNTLDVGLARFLSRGQVGDDPVSV